MLKSTVLIFTLIPCLTYANNNLKPLSWADMRKLLSDRYFEPLILEKPFKDLNTMSGQEIVAVVTPKKPFVEFKDANKTELTGYIGDMWKELEARLKFKTKFVEKNLVDGKLFLMTGKADVLLSPVVQKAADLDYFDYTMPLGSTWYHFHSMKDDNGGTSEVYLMTWKSFLWYAFFITIGVLTIFLWLAFAIRIQYGLDVLLTPSLHLERKLQGTFWPSKEERKYSDCELDPSMPNCFLNVLGSVTVQGEQISMTSTSTRIIGLLCSLFGLVMVNSYSAMLVSKLTISTPAARFASLESLMESRSNALCVSETSFVYTWFRNEIDGRILKEWRDILNAKPCSNAKSDLVPLEDYCHPNTIVLETPHNLNLQWSNGTSKCGVIRFKERFSFLYFSLLVRKNFSHTTTISKEMLKFHSAGVVQHLQERWMPRTIYTKTKKTSEYAATFNHISKILKMYGMAVIVALGVLILELFANQLAKLNI